MAVRGKFANKVRRKRGWVPTRAAARTRTLDGCVDGDELQLRECARDIKPDAVDLDLFSYSNVFWENQLLLFLKSCSLPREKLFISLIADM